MAAASASSPPLVCVGDGGVTSPNQELLVGGVEHFKELQGPSNEFNGGQPIGVITSQISSQSLAIIPYDDSGLRQIERLKEDIAPVANEEQLAMVPVAQEEHIPGEEGEDYAEDAGKDGWEAARAWLWTLPKRRNVVWEEVEDWLQANRHRLSREIVSMPRVHLFRYLVSQHKLMRRTEQRERLELLEPPTARFRRSDKWRPVYAWLESLDTMHVVGAKIIDEWLARNPALKNELQSKHTRHHLFHYIQKCHTGILKKRSKQGLNGTMTQNKKMSSAEGCDGWNSPHALNNSDKVKQTGIGGQLDKEQKCIETVLMNSIQGVQSSDDQAKQACALLIPSHELGTETGRSDMGNQAVQNSDANSPNTLGKSFQEQQMIEEKPNVIQGKDLDEAQNYQDTDMQLAPVVENTMKSYAAGKDAGSAFDKSEAQRRYEILADLQARLWELIVRSKEEMGRVSKQAYLFPSDRPSTSAAPFPSDCAYDLQIRPGSLGNAVGTSLDGQALLHDEEFEGRSRRRSRDSAHTQQDNTNFVSLGHARSSSMEIRSRKKRKKVKDSMDHAMQSWSFSVVSSGVGTPTTGHGVCHGMGVLAFNSREQCRVSSERATLSQSKADDMAELHSATNIVRHIHDREKGAGTGSCAHPFLMVGSHACRQWRPFIEGWETLGKQFVGCAAWLQRRFFSTWLPCWSAYTSSVAVAAPLGMMDQGVQKVLDVRFHPHNLPQLVCSSNAAPNELLLYNLISGRATELVGHNCQIQAVEYAANGACIVSCGSNLVKVWDSTTGACLHTLGPRLGNENLVGHKKKINAMAVNQSQACLVATSGGEGDSQLLLWNVQSGELVHDLNGNLRQKHDILPCMDALEFCNQNLLICGSDSTSGGPAIVQIWDVDSPQTCASFPAHDSYITCLKLDSLGKTIVSGAGDGTVALFDIRSCGGIARLPLGLNCEVTSVSFSSCGTYFQASSTANNTLVWDMRMMPLEPGPMPSGKPLEVADRASYKLRALHRLSHGTPMPTSENAGQLPGFVDEGDQGVNDARWFHDTGVLVTVSGNGSIAMWDVSLGQPCVRHLTSHSRCINTVAISFNDKYICSGGDDQKVVLYQDTREKNCSSWRLTHPLNDDSQTV